ncbi:MAG: plastocyanin/azurin family copper-binding protein [Gaiellaceae bacterium]
MTRQDSFRPRLWLPLMLVLALAGAAAAGMVARAGTTANKATVVKVTEKEFSLSFSTKTFKPGAYVFMAIDKGRFPHSLEIDGPGVHNKRIPGTLSSGQTRSLKVTLRAGTYHIWCPVPGHAAKGMKATITVAGASSSGGSGGQTTTSSSTTTKSSWA